MAQESGPPPPADKAVKPPPKLWAYIKVHAAWARGLMFESKVGARLLNEVALSPGQRSQRAVAGRERIDIMDCRC